MIDYTVISIGALAANDLWGERAPVRTGHATTTLITCGKRRILVDPGLPEQVITARLHERTGLAPEAITDVFLTSFSPDARRGLMGFRHAAWWIAPQERESAGVPLAGQLARMSQDEEADEEIKGALEQAVAILKRCQPAPDELAKGLTLFPLAGVTPGMAGLMIETSRYGVLVCGDAVPTAAHLERGQVLPEAADIEAARNSLAEAVEVADFLVCGRDNVVPNLARQVF